MAKVPTMEAAHLGRHFSLPLVIMLGDCLCQEAERLLFVGALNRGFHPAAFKVQLIHVHRHRLLGFSEVSAQRGDRPSKSDFFCAVRIYLYKMLRRVMR